MEQKTTKGIFKRSDWKGRPLDSKEFTKVMSWIKIIEPDIIDTYLSAHKKIAIKTSELKELRENQIKEEGDNPRLQLVCDNGSDIIFGNVQNFRLYALQNKNGEYSLKLLTIPTRA